MEESTVQSFMPDGSPLSLIIDLLRLRPDGFSLFYGGDHKILADVQENYRNSETRTLIHGFGIFFRSGMPINRIAAHSGFSDFHKLPVITHFTSQ